MKIPVSTSPTTKTSSAPSNSPVAT
jgi:hypothetical protein